MENFQSVFGITNFEFGDRDWQFIVIMVAVCVPFFLLIFLLRTHKTKQGGCRKLWVEVSYVLWRLIRMPKWVPNRGFRFPRCLARIPLQVWSTFRRKIWDLYVKRRAGNGGENQTEMV
jgi:hypothetical protein